MTRSARPNQVFTFLALTKRTLYRYGGGPPCEHQWWQARTQGETL